MGCFGMTTRGADDGVADGRAFGGISGLFPKPRRWNSGVDDEEALKDARSQPEGYVLNQNFLCCWFRHNST